MVETEFIKGKWYGNHPMWEGFYIKCNNFDGKIINSNEQINLKNLGWKFSKNLYLSHLEGYKQVEISEIAKYLPKNHPDLEQNILQSLEIW